MTDLCEVGVFVLEFLLSLSLSVVPFEVRPISFRSSWKSQINLYHVLMLFESIFFCISCFRSLESCVPVIRLRNPSFILHLVSVMGSSSFYITSWALIFFWWKFFHFFFNFSGCYWSFMSVVHKKTYIASGIITEL